MFKEIKASDIKENICDLLKNNWGLVTAGNSDKFNTMTVSWGSMGELWGKDSVTVYIRPQRYTEEFMNSNDHFTLSFYPLDKKQAIHGICGSKSGRDVDKVDYGHRLYRYHRGFFLSAPRAYLPVRHSGVRLFHHRHAGNDSGFRP